MAFVPDLSPGEKLLWSGRPVGGIRFRTQDIVAIPFSMLWAGFAFFWEWQVLHIQTRGPGVFFELWGIPFVLVGLYITIGRFFWDLFVRSRTQYAVTDRRALILVLAPMGSRSLRSVPLASAIEITLSERRDGSGEIVFGSTGGLSWLAFGRGGRTAAPRFELAGEVRRIYELIVRTQASTAAG